MAIGDFIEKAKRMVTDTSKDAEDRAGDAGDGTDNAGNRARQSAEHDKLSSGDAMNNDPASGILPAEEVQ